MLCPHCGKTFEIAPPPPPVTVDAINEIASAIAPVPPMKALDEIASVIAVVSPPPIPASAHAAEALLAKVDAVLGRRSERLASAIAQPRKTVDDAYAAAMAGPATGG